MGPAWVRRAWAFSAQRQLYNRMPVTNSSRLIKLIYQPAVKAAFCYIISIKEDLMWDIWNAKMIMSKYLFAPKKIKTRLNKYLIRYVGGSTFYHKQDWPSAVLFAVNSMNFPEIFTVKSNRGPGSLSWQHEGQSPWNRPTSKDKEKDATDVCT